MPGALPFIESGSQSQILPGFERQQPDSNSPALSFESVMSSVGAAQSEQSVQTGSPAFGLCPAGMFPLSEHVMKLLAAIEEKVLTLPDVDVSLEVEVSSEAEASLKVEAEFEVKIGGEELTLELKPEISAAVSDAADNVLYKPDVNLTVSVSGDGLPEENMNGEATELKIKPDVLASLSSEPETAKEAESLNSKNSKLEEKPEDEKSEGENIDNSLIASRMASFVPIAAGVAADGLKPEAKAPVKPDLKVQAQNKPVNNGEAAVSEGEASSELNTLNAPVKAVVAPGGKNAGEDAQGGKEDGDSGTGGNTGNVRASLRRPAAASDSTNKTETELGAPSENHAGTRSAFQSFFDGVMARRQQPDVNTGPMNLNRGSLMTASETLNEGMNNVVRFVRMAGEHRATLIVEPPSLGRISVELRSVTAGIEASIKVSSEQIRYLVQEQISQLRTTLAQQGVQLTQFSVDVHQDGGHGQQFNQGDGRGQQPRHTAEIDADEDNQDQENSSVFRVDLNQGLLYWMA